MPIVKCTYPMSSSAEEIPRVWRMLLVSFVWGPRPSCALIIAVKACAEMPYPLKLQKVSPSMKSDKNIKMCMECTILSEIYQYKSASNAVV